MATHATHVDITEGQRVREALPAVRLADPAPLGLGAFAMTTMVLSVFNAGLITTPGADAVVLPLALFYGGLAQLLAGMWEFRNGNTFGSLAFTSFGAFWLSFAALVRFVAPGLPASDAHTAIAVFLLGWTIFTAYMFIASLRVSVAVALVLLVLALTYLFLTIGAFQSENFATATATKIGGWLGLVTALLAWYASFAGVMSSTFGRTILPTRPLS
jgi:uncharacterized protein